MVLVSQDDDGRAVCGSSPFLTGGGDPTPPLDPAAQEEDSRRQEQDRQENVGEHDHEVVGDGREPAQVAGFEASCLTLAQVVPTLAPDRDRVEALVVSCAELMQLSRLAVADSSLPSAPLHPSAVVVRLTGTSYVDHDE